MKDVFLVRRGHIKKMLSMASIITRGHSLFLLTAFNAALEYADKDLGVGTAIQNTGGPVDVGRFCSTPRGDDTDGHK